jgi:cytoskeletal protein CcmA (bactofilin family)
VALAPRLAIDLGVNNKWNGQFGDPAVQNSGTRTVSTVGEDLTITGDVTSKGEIHLDGHVQGDVNCGALVLGENSSVEGNVRADEVVIRGRLIGSVRAFRLMLQSTSHVEGDLIHQSLAMEQGAFFEGKSRRSDDPLSKSQTTAAKPVPTKPQPPGRDLKRQKEEAEGAFVRDLPEPD